MSTVSTTFTSFGFFLGFPFLNKRISLYTVFLFFLFLFVVNFPPFFPPPPPPPPPIFFFFVSPLFFWLSFFFVLFVFFASFFSFFIIIFFFLFLLFFSLSSSLSSSFVFFFNFLIFNFSFLFFSFNIFFTSLASFLSIFSIRIISFSSLISSFLSNFNRSFSCKSSKYAFDCTSIHCLILFHLFKLRSLPARHRIVIEFKKFEADARSIPCSLASLNTRVRSLLSMACDMVLAGKDLAPKPRPSSMEDLIVSFVKPSAGISL